MNLEQLLIDVWRQALVNKSKTVTIGDQTIPVNRTSSGLRQIDFEFDGEEIHGLEQNPNTKSKWAEMARSGRIVMQFLDRGRYMANVVDGKVTLYVKRTQT